MSELLSALNEEQAKIVQETEGYRLVLAGAGTGKSRTLVYNVAYLREQNLAEPWEILAITFTNKAANEMKSRLIDLLQIKNLRKWWIGTIHGVCVRLLIKYGEEIGITKNFVIADEADQVRLIKEILETDDTINLEPKTVLEIISWAKNNLKNPADMANESKSKPEENLAKIYEIYQERLQAMNVMDFDDLIMRVIHLLNQVPRVRTELQKQFKYIFVDESQDLNLANYELVRILSDEHKNLCLIGDQDQGIYSWRGANIDIVNNFSEYPQTKILRLERNYRCSKTIVQASNDLIKKNKNRVEKTLYTENCQGDPIIYYAADTEYSEASFVSGIVNHLCHRERTNDYKDFCIIYRTNLQSRLIEDAMMKAYIPYQMIGGISFYERREVKDILAYLRLIINPHDMLSFQRVINVPRRGVGKKAMERLIDHIGSNGNHVLDSLQDPAEIEGLSKKAVEAITVFVETMEKYTKALNKIPPERFIKELANETGYLDYIEKDSGKDAVMNVYELAQMAENWNEENHEDPMEAFVRELSLISDSDMLVERDNSVKLMTSHTAKGLEFPHVFIIGAEENIFPHILAIQSQSQETREASVEEERRLFYVSMTRAKEKLYITRAIKRTFFKKPIENQESRFIKDIPSNFIKKI